MTGTLQRGVLLVAADKVAARSDEWLAARGLGIGASEIATVLGISPWDSPFSLYWRKKLATPTDMNEAMEWGLRHEQAIADKFAENHPDVDLEPAGLYRHAEHAWMLATPDRLARTVGDGPIELVQIKTTHSWDGWGEPGTDQIPVYYRAQVQQEMAVMGAARCSVPVLAGGNSYREYFVDYDQADVDAIVTAGAAFMARLAGDDPPDIDGSAATTKAIKALHPDLIDEPVTVPLDLADQYSVRKALLDDAKAAYDEVSNRMLAAVGNYRYGVADGRKVAIRQVYDTTRLDTRRLKAEQPDMYAELIAEYGNTTTISKITPPKESK